MSCECNIVGLLTTSIQGIFSASINGGTSIEIAEDGTVLLGSTVSTLTIGAYAFAPGGDRLLGATCPFSASASIPWVTKRDCETGTTYFIPRGGGTASTTNFSSSRIDSSIIQLTCTPGINSRSLDANSSSGPAAPYLFSDRVDGFNLVYTGNPLSVASGAPRMYSIDLGFVGTINAYLQSFSLTVSPPDVARVNYSFVFSGVVL